MAKVNARKKLGKGASEFKEFIMRGNVVDLAVGVIIGGAFGSIVTSLVNDILMPIVGAIIGGIDFSGLSITIGNANIMYGNFIQNVIDFLIIAACVFVLVKAVNKLTKKKEGPKIASTETVHFDVTNPEGPDPEKDLGVKLNDWDGFKEQFLDIKQEKDPNKITINSEYITKEGSDKKVRTDTFINK